MPGKTDSDMAVPDISEIEGLPPEIKQDPKSKVVVLGRQIRIGKYVRAPNGRTHLVAQGYVVDGRYYTIIDYKTKFDRFGNPRPVYQETGPARRRARKPKPGEDEPQLPLELPEPSPEAQEACAQEEPQQPAAAAHKRRGRAPHPVKGAKPEPGVSYQFKKRADGRFTVVKIWSAYDPVLKNNSAYKNKTLGITDVAYDITHLEATPRMRAAQKRTAGLVRHSSERAAPARRERQAASLYAELKYPFSIAALVIIAALMSGAKTSRGIASFWSLHRDGWLKVFPDFPACDLPPEVVGKIVERAGLESDNEVLREFLRTNIGQRLAELQAPLTNGDKPLIEALSLCDSPLGIVLSLDPVGAGTNDISRFLSVVMSMNLYGCIVTCGALNMTKNACAAIRAAGGDYCLAVCGDHDLNERDIEAIFRAEPDASAQLKVFEGDYARGNARMEHRLVRLLPARRINSNLRERWPGLEDGSGCLVEATAWREPGQRVTRFFVSTLDYFADDAAKAHAHLLQSREGLEQPFWGLDVVFGQSHWHCQSGPLAKGCAALDRVACFLLRELKALGCSEGLSGQMLTGPALQRLCSAPEKIMPALCRVFSKSAVQGQERA